MLLDSLQGGGLCRTPPDPPEREVLGGDVLAVVVAYAQSSATHGHNLTQVAVLHAVHILQVQVA